MTDTAGTMVERATIAAAKAAGLIWQEGATPDLSVHEAVARAVIAAIAALREGSE